MTLFARQQESTRDSSVRLRTPVLHDGAALYGLVASCPPLDLNSRYAYLLLCKHHAQTCVIAELQGALIGAVTAYVRDEEPGTLFIWQVAVSPTMRGQRLATRMLEHLLSRCVEPRRLRWMEATIAPSNLASNRLFMQFCKQHRPPYTTSPFFSSDDFGGNGHEEECLYRIGPFGGTS